MLTIFRHTFAKSRGQILGWGLTLAVLGGYMISFYDTLVSQQGQMVELLKNYPPELMAFFGDFTKMFTPAGYLSVEFFSYMPMILGIFAVLVGSGLLASDEENGSLDLILAHPISRTALFAGRLLAFIASLIAILFIVWLGFLVAMNWTHFEMSALELALPFISLLVVVLLYGALALLLSTLLPSRRLAAMIAGLVVVADFFLIAMARIDTNLETAAKFMPTHYYQGAEAANGLNWEWTAGLLGVTLVLVLLAWWRFERRDIRVGGEGGWGLTFRIGRQSVGSFRH